MRVVQASGEKEQWILSKSDQPIVSKMTLNGTPMFLNFKPLYCTMGHRGCMGTGTDAPLVRGRLLLVSSYLMCLPNGLCRLSVG